jgi:hypothetical protein
VTRIAVPRPYRESLVELAELDQEAAEKLIRTVEALPAFVAVTEIDRALREHMEPARAASAVAALLSLRAQNREATPHDIAIDLSGAQGLDLPDDARGMLASRAEALLATAAFSTTSVAVDLQTRHARNFQSARIFTDVRPVFQGEVEEGVSGAVIVETLELQTWNRSGGTEEIFVALDEQDLLQLQGAVDRALKKTRALRTFLDQQGVPYFELEKEGE